MWRQHASSNQVQFQPTHVAYFHCFHTTVLLQTAALPWSQCQDDASVFAAPPSPDRLPLCFLPFLLSYVLCRLYVNWRFLHGIEAQFLALQKGFNEVIPQHLLKSFDEKELEVKEKTGAFKHISYTLKLVLKWQRGLFETGKFRCCSLFLLLLLLLLLKYTLVYLCHYVLVLSLQHKIITKSHSFLHWQILQIL